MLRTRSEPQRGADGDHRRAADVRGLDDLAATSAAAQESS
jgi:hypothetical protein